MTEDDVAHAIREQLERLFPKTCTTCGRAYANLREYIRDTEPLGAPVSYDADARDWNPANPLGAMVMANCACGSTLALTSTGMDLERLHAVMAWLRAETQAHGVRPSEILARLRERVRQEVLG